MCLVRGEYGDTREGGAITFQHLTIGKYCFDILTLTIKSWVPIRRTLRTLSHLTFNI